KAKSNRKSWKRKKSKARQKLAKKKKRHRRTTQQGVKNLKSLRWKPTRRLVKVKGLNRLKKLITWQRKPQKPPLTWNIQRAKSRSLRKKNRARRNLQWKQQSKQSADSCLRF